MKPEYLRQSQIKAWLNCPAQYYAQYVLGINLGEHDPNMEYGTYIHKQVEEYHLGHEYDATDLGPYLEVYSPDDFTRVELAFSFTPHLPGSLTGRDNLPAYFTGIIDRYWKEDGLHDFKTSQSSYSQNKIDAPLGISTSFGYDGTGLQATAYCYYWWQNRGTLVPFTFDVLRKDRKKKGERYPLQRVTTTRTVEDFKNFWLLCNKLINDISNEEVWPCNCRSRAHAVWSNAKELV